MRQFRRILDDYSTPESPRIAIGEIHLFDPVALARYYGDALDELHLPFHFGLLGAAWTAHEVRRVVNRYEAALPRGAWPNYVLGNHDEQRIATRVGVPAARLAMLLLLSLRGTPTMYYADELGLADVPIPPEREQDPWNKRVPGLGLGRDPARTPMPWDATPNAGFCAPDVEPWLPINTDYRETNVATQLAEPTSMLNLTRRALELRHASPALEAGAYRAVDAEGVPKDCYVFLREARGEQVLVALNFADDERVIRLPSATAGSIKLSSYLDREGEVDLSALALRPSEGCLIQL
jgi:alpha-glucosidase